MKPEAIIKDNLVLVICGDEFAVIERTIRNNGLQGITFSMPVTSKIADVGVTEIWGTE